jgi:rSAM/selenodomain-associated transferase 1
MGERLILFAKRPRTGEVKTRLVPPLTPEQARSVYVAFLEDQMRFVASLARSGRAVELSMDGPWRPRGGLAAAAAALERTEQGRGDLGERLARAFERSCASGHAPTVVLGVDTPTLPASHVEAAFRRLGEGADAVVSPADDGGYVLIGMSEPRPDLFEAIPWGGAGVLQATRRRAAAAGVRLVEIASWYDVDEIEGLSRLGRELSRPAGRRRAPSAARALARGLPAPPGDSRG